MPDVAVPTAPALSSLRRVELVHTGRWPVSSGTWNPSREDLIQAIAALDCPAVRLPVLKLGHSQGEQPLWAGNPTGAPAVGWVDNMATTNQGHTLVGDFVGMPGWLGDVAASAYPDRSVEGKYDHKCQIGHTHPFVITAVALLGVTPPGVGTLRSLQDVGRLYGVEATTTPEPDVVAHLLGEHNQQDHGRRGTGLAGSILSTVLETAAGPVSIDARPDGMHLSYGSSQSGALNRQAGRQLADLLEFGSSGGDDDDDSAYDRPPRAVFTHTDDGPPSGFAQVTNRGGVTELELLSDENTHRLTRPEAQRLAEAVRQHAVANRVDTDAGPVDMFLDGPQIGLRVPDDDGGRTDVRFPVRDWARVSNAINVVWEGFDELGRITDPEVDLDALRVQTDLGPLLVTRRGDPDGDPTLTVRPVDGGWDLSWQASSDGFFDAMTWLEDTAGLDEFSDASSTRRGITVHQPTVAATAPDDHVEGLTLGDSEAELDLWADGTVTLGWDDHQTVLDMAEAEDLVGAINEVRGGKATSARVDTDPGGLTSTRDNDGDVQLGTEDMSVLLSDDDAFDMQNQLVDWINDDNGVQARAFDPGKHPRWPAGTPGGLGGKFMPRNLVPRQSGGTESRSTRRSAPPARAPQRRVPTGVNTVDQTTPDNPPAPDPSANPVEDQIRTAYADLVANREPGSVNRWVKLSDLRPALSGGTREEVDAELDRMIERPDVNLMAELNQRTLTDRDRRAAVTIGGEPRHLLMIDEQRQESPTQRPTPARRRSVDVPEGLVDNLRAADTRESAAALLDGLTAAQLKQVADEIGAPYAVSWRKAQVRDAVVQRARLRTEFDALQRGGGGPGVNAAELVQVQAAADVHTGAMVALLPSVDDTQRLAVDGGEAAGQLHVTLLFLGEAAAYDQTARDAIVDEMRELAEVIPPGEADGMALAAFNPDKADKDTAIVLELGGDALDDVHGLVEQAVTDVAAEHGLVLPEQHSPYRPHVTLLYSDDLMNVPRLSDRAGPLRIDRIRVAFAGENVDIPLTGEGSDDPELDNVTDADMPVVASGEVVAQESRRITRSDRPLRRYWLRGKGAAKIRWNTPGDWTRCVRQLRRHLRDPKGYCAVLHKEATGVYPGDSRNVGRRNASVHQDDVVAHLPGRHDQSAHGRRFNIPRDPTSGLRPRRSRRPAAEPVLQETTFTRPGRRSWRNPDAERGVETVENYTITGRVVSREPYPRTPTRHLITIQGPGGDEVKVGEPDAVPYRRAMPGDRVRVETEDREPDREGAYALMQKPPEILEDGSPELTPPPRPRFETREFSSLTVPQRRMARRLASRYGNNVEDTGRHLDVYMALQRGQVTPDEVEQLTGHRPNVEAAEEASILPNPNPTIIHAAAKVTVDDVRTAWHRQAPQHQWIREFATEPKELIVANDADGSVARVSFEIDDDGGISFAEPKRVRVAYVEDEEPETVAASRLVYASAAESRPSTVTGQAVQAASVSDKPWSDFDASDYTPAEWRRATLLDRGPEAGDEDTKGRYGLPVREPDGTLNRNAVHAAAGGHGIGAVEGISDRKRRSVARKIVRLYRDKLDDDPPDSLLSLAGMSTQAAAPDPQEPPAAEPDPSPTKEDDMSLTEVRQRLGLADDAEESAVLAALDELKTKADTAPDPQQVAAAAAEKTELTKEVDLLKGQVEAMSAKIAESESAKAAEVKASVLNTAQDKGKFAPAEREQWEQDYDAAPQAVTRVLASIADGTAVPVSPQGKVGDPQDVAASLDEEEDERIFSKLEPALAGANTKEN